ncbi:cupredoxin domain-containing protein [Psychromonas algarum]|uniref:cupredoxin domain-containing protein n=1 Tax=Psychromonas algarum TaxID=2555643 RepID=UPI001ABAA35C|nr:cupredoxin domain-containing protein [Psychromonas sp. RZ22]
MKFLRHFFLSSFIAVMAVNSFASTTEVSTSAQKDTDGFSMEFKDPRYSKLKTYLVEMKDGVLIPAELVVPEKTKFRIVIRNIGNKPAEFESNQLRQEKVLFMGAETSVVIIPLDAGTYDYFDDFAPTTRGKIIVKGKE